MVKDVEMEVLIGATTDEAVEMTFHVDEPEETEIWVPRSLIMNTNNEIEAVELSGKGTLSIMKWFLKKNDIPYPSDADRGL